MLTSAGSDRLLEKAFRHAMFWCVSRETAKDDSELQPVSTSRSTRTRRKNFDHTLTRSYEHWPDAQASFVAHALHV